MSRMLHMTVEELQDGTAVARFLIVDRSTDLPTRRDLEILESTDAAFRWCEEQAADVLGVTSVRPEWVPNGELWMWRADVRPQLG
jgi:hypothetical protein